MLKSDMAIVLLSVDSPLRLGDSLAIPLLQEDRNSTKFNRRILFAGAGNDPARDMVAIARAMTDRILEI
jgi:hypothetical protein